MTALQRDFFIRDEDLLLEEVKKNKTALNTLRRGMFATMKDLMKHVVNLETLYEELNKDNERLEKLLLERKK